LLDDQPTSVGRLFLARAFEHYCTLHFGYSGEEIAGAFRGEGTPGAVSQVRAAARLIGEALARGIVRAWARPIGGGEPVELKPGLWELDRFDHRFAASAMDPRHPFDLHADPTSWIFVDMDGWNALVEASLADHVRRPKTRTLRLGPGAPVEAGATEAVTARADDADDDRLVRLPEVKRRTGMSRSTIYRRMDEGRFPQTVPMEGNIAAWREREIAEWVADPR
jgi:prophage regulatory protein